MSSKILVLPNVWDAGSAQVFELLGFQAIGTTSAGIAYSLGYPDGEKLSKAEMLAAIKEITHAVTAPVTADIESGYTQSPDVLYTFIKEIIAAGAVGVNIEDATQKQDPPLVGIALQVAKIKAAREAAQSMKVPMVINARTDTYWSKVGSDKDRLEHTIRRLNAYREAGADCLFVPGIKDPGAITALVQGVRGPLNILGGPDVPPVAELEKLGVARVSMGSGPMRAVLTLMTSIGKELRTHGTYNFANNACSYDEANKLFEK